MAVFWKFNEDTCVFDQCDRQTAEAEADQDVPVIIREFDDLYVVLDRKKGVGQAAIRSPFSVFNSTGRITNERR